MGEDGLVSAANMSVALLCMDSAMDDISWCSPAGDQAWQASFCSKKMLVSMVSGEGFAKISAALRSDNSAAMDALAAAAASRAAAAASVGVADAGAAASAGAAAREAGAQGSSRRRYYLT
jgi:hypothetical protein